MKRNDLLTVTSLLSVLLFSIHLTDDIGRGIEPGGWANLAGFVLISVVWLCGTLLLSGRRSGQVITLLGSLLAAAVPVLHMKGVGVGAYFTRYGGFRFVWTLLALGVTGTFSLVLLASGLWSGKAGGTMAAAHADPDRRG